MLWEAAYAALNGRSEATMLTKLAGLTVFGFGVVALVWLAEVSYRTTEAWPQRRQWSFLTA